MTNQDETSSENAVNKHESHENEAINDDNDAASYNNSSHENEEIEHE